MGDRWQLWTDGSVMLAAKRKRSAALVSIDRGGGVRLVSIDGTRWWVNEVIPPWAVGRRSRPGSLAVTGPNGWGIATQWSSRLTPPYVAGGSLGPFGLVPRGAGQLLGGGIADVGDPFDTGNETGDVGDLFGTGSGTAGIFLPGGTDQGGTEGIWLPTGLGSGPSFNSGFGPGDVAGIYQPGHGGPTRHPSGTFTHSSGGTTTSDTYNQKGDLIRRDSSWTDPDGTQHDKSWDGQGNKISEDTHQTNKDGSTTDTHTEWNSTGDITSQKTTTTSADQKTTEVTDIESNGDGTYSTTKTTTEHKDDGSVEITTETDDGHGNQDSGTIIIQNNSSMPAPDDDTGGSEERPFAHALIVGKSLAWQLPAPEPGEGDEGQPLALIVREKLGDLVNAVVVGNDTGWGDAGSEQPSRHPFVDVSVEDTDSGDWGINHPQALVARALRYTPVRSSTRLARYRLQALAAALS